MVTGSQRVSRTQGPCETGRATDRKDSRAQGFLGFVLELLGFTVTVDVTPYTVIPLVLAFPFPAP